MAKSRPAIDPDTQAAARALPEHIARNILEVVERPEQANCGIRQ
jgi:hypothetical protein